MGNLQLKKMNFAELENRLSAAEMENIMAGSCVGLILSGSRDFTRRDACIICSGLGGATAGLLFGGPAGMMMGWGSGLVSSLFTC